MRLSGYVETELHTTTVFTEVNGKVYCSKDSCDIKLDHWRKRTFGVILFSFAPPTEFKLFLN